MIYWHAGVTATPRTPKTLSDTLQSIRKAGWSHPEIFHDPQRQGPYQNFLHALWTLWHNHGSTKARHMLATTSPAYLAIFQDDVEVTAGLRNDLESRAHAPIRNQDGVISLFTPAALSPLPSGWSSAGTVRAATYRWPISCGALAYIFPWWLAGRFLQNPPSPGVATRTDYWVAKWCDDNAVPYYVHTPSFIRHTGSVSSLDQPNSNDQWRQCGEWLPVV